MTDPADIIGRLRAFSLFSRSHVNPPICEEAAAFIEALTAATKALVDVIDLAMPHMNSVCVIAATHGVSYRGPEISTALEAARALIGGGDG